MDSEILPKGDHIETGRPRIKLLFESRWGGLTVSIGGEGEKRVHYTWGRWVDI